MCEPSHSIIQYQDSDDQTPFSGSSSGRSIIASALGNAVGVSLDFGKKILRWFHYSKMGNGHSEALSLATNAAHLLDRYITRYEGHWWNRSTTLDGSFRGESFDKAEALSCAEMYSRRICYGDLPTLRRFLESSLKSTDNIMSYVISFELLLTKSAFADLGSKLKRSLNTNLVWNTPHAQLSAHRNSITKLLLGYTRRRRMLQSPWADDAALWIPSS